jgi:hypothetical protein
MSSVGQVIASLVPNQVICSLLEDTQRSHPQEDASVLCQMGDFEFYGGLGKEFLLNCCEGESVVGKISPLQFLRLQEPILFALEVVAEEELLAGTEIHEGGDCAIEDDSGILLFEGIEAFYPSIDGLDSDDLVVDVGLGDSGLHVAHFEVGILQIRIPYLPELLYLTQRVLCVRVVELL